MAQNRCPDTQGNRPRTRQQPPYHSKKLLKTGYFKRTHPWHDLCYIYLAGPPTRPRRTAMKLETMLLNSLFVACLVICVTALGSMLA
jgi:hypothetical protein